MTWLWIFPIISCLIVLLPWIIDWIKEKKSKRMKELEEKFNKRIKKLEVEFYSHKWEQKNKDKPKGKKKTE